MSCLSKHASELDSECKLQLLRVAELQADDYHKDRQLFLACRDDRENFCHGVRAGGGAIYKCLYKHKFELKMSQAVSVLRYFCLCMCVRPNLTLTALFKDSRVPMKIGRSFTGTREQFWPNAIPAAVNDSYGYKRELNAGLLGSSPPP